MENNEHSATDPNDNLKALRMVGQYKVKHVDNNLVAKLNDEQLMQHHFTTFALRTCLIYSNKGSLDYIESIGNNKCIQ